jgi:hypothetical protein
MSRSSVTLKVKKEIALRAGFRCEYCLLSERVSYFSFHIEHIRSIKHGGENNIENLAYCCPDCNFYKGTDVGTFVGSEFNLVRFFNPRVDTWQEHFEIQEANIYGKSEIGIATAQIFKCNEIDRLIFRKQLAELGLYP